MPNRLLIAANNAPPLPGPACELLTIDGVAYRHSAAKFWPRLMDEALALHPDCTRIELAALTTERLDPLRLDPQAELERDARDLADAQLQDIINDTVAQLTLYGPPSLVRVRLLAEGLERYTAELPADCADAEVFLYLAGWMLEWGHVPHALWKQDRLASQFTAQDRRRSRAYHVRFSTQRDHVREGLYRILMTIDPRVCDPSAA